MGQSGLFRCGRCGYEAELNLSQPDCGMMGEVKQFFCPAKKEIARIFLGLRAFVNVPEHFVCCKCAYHTKDEDCNDINEQLWYETHPECRMENLQELMIIKEDDNVSYHCPRKDCDGIMFNTGELILCWD